jgi:hypothetical protein
MVDEVPDVEISTLIFEITSEDLSMCVVGANCAIDLTRDEPEVVDEYSVTDFARFGTRHTNTHTHTHTNTHTHTHPEILFHTTTHVHRLKAVLLRLYTEISEENIGNWPGDYIFILLNRLKLTFAAHDAFVQLLGAAVTLVDYSEDSESIECIALKKLELVIRTVFRGTQQLARKHAQYYCVRTQGSNDSRVISTLSYWSDTSALRMRFVTDSTELTTQVLRP